MRKPVRRLLKSVHRLILSAPIFGAFFISRDMIVSNRLWFYISLSSVVAYRGGFDRFQFSFLL